MGLQWRQWPQFHMMLKKIGGSMGLAGQLDLNRTYVYASKKNKKCLSIFNQTCHFRIICESTHALPRRMPNHATCELRTRLLSLCFVLIGRSYHTGVQLVNLTAQVVSSQSAAAHQSHWIFVSLP